MALHYQETDPIILGSGELYIGKVDNPETADETAVEAALKNLGAIESGCVIKYTPTIKEIESANRGTVLRIITKETLTLNTGIMTWVIDNLAVLSGGKVTTDATSGTKKMKIGMGSLPINYVRFVHKKHDGSGTLTVNIYRAQAINGFELTLDREKPTTIGYEFSALSSADGTLCEIVETFATQA